MRMRPGRDECQRVDERLKEVRVGGGDNRLHVPFRGVRGVMCKT
jgi:hypothetical protein